MTCTFPKCQCDHPATCGLDARNASDFADALNEWFRKTDWLKPTPAELGKHRADVLRERIERMEVENALLRADAERYRWLRDEAWAGDNISKPFPRVFVLDGAGNRKTELAEDALDSAVDDARSKT